MHTRFKQRICSPQDLTRRISQRSLTSRNLPIRVEQIRILNRRHNKQAHRRTHPHTLEPPPEPKRQPDGQGQRDDIVGEQVCWPADGLLADAAQDAVGAGGDAVEELHEGGNGHDGGDDGDDLVVVGEEEGELVAEGAEEGEVEEADDTSGDEGLK